MAITAGKAIDAQYLLKQLKAFDTQVIGKKYNVKFQYTEMPEASEELAGQCAQYIGTTTENYTTGSFYICNLKDGVYTWISLAVNIPEYTIKKDASPSSDDYAATYHIVKDGVAIGDPIDIPKDFFLTDAKFGIATAEDVAEGGKLAGKGFIEGDAYLELDVNIIDGTETSVKKIFCNMSGLVDTYTSGNGIAIEDNQISVKINEEGPITVDENGVNLAINDDLKINPDKKLVINFETKDIDFSTDW